MKTSILTRNGVSQQVVDLIGRLVDLIPWPTRKSSMGDVTMSHAGRQRLRSRAVPIGGHRFRLPLHLERFSLE
jgi:hypothetical protein